MKIMKNRIKKANYLINEAIRRPNEIIPFIHMKCNGILMHIKKNSIFSVEKELSMCSLQPKKMIDMIVEIYHPNSVLDLGCGSGKAIDYFLEKGVKEVYGVEGSKMAISHSKNPKLIKNYDLNHSLDLKKKFDIIYSFEFIEHIHPKYVDNLLKTFSNHSNVIIITAARPGQHGQGHFNCQLPPYWIKKFSEYGFKFNQKNTDILKKCRDKFYENILVFERKINKNIQI